MRRLCTRRTTYLITSVVITTVCTTRSTASTILGTVQPMEQLRFQTTYKTQTMRAYQAMPLVFRVLHGHQWFLSQNQCILFQIRLGENPFATGAGVGSAVSHAQLLRQDATRSQPFVIMPEGIGTGVRNVQEMPHVRHGSWRVGQGRCFRKFASYWTCPWTIEAGGRNPGRKHCMHPSSMQRG